MAETTTNEVIIQPNQYAGGITAPPFSMPNAKKLPSDPGGTPSNGSQSQGGSDLTMDGNVSMSGQGTQLHGTQQNTDSTQSGSAQPTNPGTDFHNTVTGTKPGINQVGGSGPASSGTATGWCKSGNDWYYIDPETGKLATGWKFIGNRWYYLDPETGVMVTGWVMSKGLWYYLEPGDGHMLIDWQTINGNEYYLETDNGNGNMVTGWKWRNDAWYFLHEDGAMAYGDWLMIDGKWYYLHPDGRMAALEIAVYDKNGEKYYLGADGAMITKVGNEDKQVTYNGITYDVGIDGICTEVPQQISTQYYMGSDESKQIEYIFGTSPGGQTWSQYSKGLYSKVGKDLKTVKFPIWALSANGEKISKEKKLTIHEKVADIVVIIFNEIYNSSEKFPIDNATTGGYGERNKITSLHNFGLAIDINWDANAMFNSSGKIIAGKHYKPGTDPLSIPANSSVVRIFKKYNWYWGGEWKNSKDYMHFAYMNH